MKRSSATTRSAGSRAVVVVQELLDRALAGVVAAADAGDRHVLVERLVLLAGRRLDGGDDLPGDAQLGERTERRLVLGAEVAGRLVEADQRLLLDVVGVAADEEVAPGPGPGEPAVALEEDLERVLTAGLEAGRQARRRLAR